MTAASNEVVAVIQADRDMVQAFHRLRLNKLMEAIKDEKAGARFGEDEGDAGDLVQAFARHRIAHSDPRPVAEGLRERIKEVLIAHGHRRCSAALEGLGDILPEIEATAAEIAALATHSPAPMAGEGWQDIASAPKDGSWVDLWWTRSLDGHGARVTDAIWFDGAWRQSVEWSDDMPEDEDGFVFIDGYGPSVLAETPLCKATHWMRVCPPAAAHPSTQEGSR